MGKPKGEHWVKHLIRLVLFTFLLTFASARIIVFLIMTRQIPDLYLHLGGTHVHHLNYGIVLLSALGAYLLFRRPTGRGLEMAAITYGVGLALTFDEFGMWLHLGGGYWQRTSFDAVAVIAAILGLLAFAPPLWPIRPRHILARVVILAACVAFFALMIKSLHHAADRLTPRLQELELRSPR